METTAMPKADSEKSSWEMMKEGYRESTDLMNPDTWKPLEFYLATSRLIIGLICGLAIGFVVGLIVGGC